MDPITQGALGAVATQSLFQKKLGRDAWKVGAAGGMLADLDVLIQYFVSTPLANFQYHRHFTHQSF
jgi:inner membrane protein